MVNILWQDERRETPFVVPDDVQDLVFRVDARSVPLDHAHDLSRAILSHLPWMEEEPEAGIHLIHGAESGNGWERPRDPDSEILHLSRRTRMSLRLPKRRMEQGLALTGRTLDIAGHPVEVRNATTRPLSPMTTLFSRHVVADNAGSEEHFIDTVVSELRQRGITVRKLLCGREHYFSVPGRRLLLRSILLADLDIEHSVQIQQRGVGPGRKLGCGLFLPHKGIAPVSTKDQF